MRILLLKDNFYRANNPGKHKWSLSFRHLSWVDFERILGAFQEDFGWIWRGFRVDFERISDGFWEDFGGISGGFRQDFKWISIYNLREFPSFHFSTSVPVSSLQRTWNLDVEKWNSYCCCAVNFFFLQRLQRLNSLQNQILLHSKQTFKVLPQFALAANGKKF